MGPSGNLRKKVMKPRWQSAFADMRQVNPRVGLNACLIPENAAAAIRR
jgi:hypothetical protein